jgi:hypothetical protein
MRATEFLLEYKRDITKRNYYEDLFRKLADDSSIPKGPNSLYDFWSKRQQDGPNDRLSAAISNKLDIYLQEFENVDPTPNKQYVQWLVRMYINGAFNMLEDIKSTGTDFYINGTN